MSLPRLNSLAAVDWDECGEVSQGVFFPESLALHVHALESWPLSEVWASSSSSRSTEEKRSDGEHDRVPLERWDSSSEWAQGRPAEDEEDDSVSGASKAKKKGAREETEEEKRKRRAMVAASSRATRAKKKREREDLTERIGCLEKERELYLAKIAQLQTEVQMLRDGGAINLEKENELLRTEIRKHKAFIYNIVSATKSVPNSTDEEKYRLVKNGSDSAIGQVIGLAYTSVADPSWFNGKLRVTEDLELPVRIQLLPLGATTTDVKRINLRLDMPDRQESIHTFREKLFVTWSDPAAVEKLINHITDNNTRAELKEIKTNFSEVSSGSSNMQVYYYTEEDRSSKSGDNPKKRDSIFVLTWEWTRTFNHLFPNMPQGPNSSMPIGYETVLKDDPESTCVLCSATTIADEEYLRPQESGIHRIDSPLIEGHILRRKPEGGTKWTVCYSLPIGNESYAGLTPADGCLVNEDGTLGPIAEKTITAVLGLLEETKS